jgi:hypothetical protein
MSEYQYYEFLVIDRPLTSKEQAAVREFSTRAQISSTSFTNEYQWGDFKGDPHKFLEKWFDAHVYLANWGTRRFMFRVPKDLIDLSLAKACCDGDAASLEVRGEWAIFDLVLEPDDGGDWEDDDGSGWMATLAPARADLLRGDLRILYLGWLLRAQSDELEDDDVEPFVPPGLAKLSAPLQGLVDFLGIDGDLLDVAAEKSGAAVPESSEKNFAAWLAALPSAEKDALLLSCCEGRDPMAATRLRRRFEATRPKTATAEGQRTVRELLDGAARRTEEREREEAERAAVKRARAKAQAEALRAKQLDELAAREPEAWRQAVKLIMLKTPKGYDEAIGILHDLRDLAARSNRLADFSTRLNALRADHAGKPSFMGRLRKAGL